MSPSIGKGERSKVVAKAKSKRPFNVQTFLSTVDGGRTISTYQKNQKIFSQGDPADAVFYIKEGKVKVSILSEFGKEAVVALHGKEDFLAKAA
jgi:CRP/FNR family cyclic AMP-dependent transcriptional regulator